MVDLSAFIQPDRRCWRYRLDAAGQVEGKIFAQPDLAPDGEGWVDSPADVAPVVPPKTAEPDTKPKRGRPRAVVLPGDDANL